MAARPPVRPTARPPPDDAAEKPRRGSLRWVRDVLTRSIRLEQRNGQRHVVLAAAKRGLSADAPLTLLEEQRADLGARLLVHDPSQMVRHLFVIHDELRNRGWAGVQALPPEIPKRALAEAEILETQEPSPMLASVIESLAKIVRAADARAAQELLLREEWEAPAAPEVSETNFDEYELMERSWIGTVPNGLDPAATRP
jgi:hypothetical protein